MDSKLYPMKFMPLFKNVVWGGNRIKDLGFDYSPLPNCGELWALSSVEGRESVVANGFLEGNNLAEVLEIYMGELVGERNYEHFGNTFPVLVKLIDSADRLSVQVHPDDSLARERGMENGKTEMWYVMQADPGSEIIDGFATDVTPDEYQQALQLGKLEQIMHVEHPVAGDCFFIPAGRVHALGKGLMVAEIQQTSDCTYRIYDYNRPDANGRLRELHTAEALAALDFGAVTDGRSPYTRRNGATMPLQSNAHFTVNLVDIEKPVRKDLSQLDSFVAYLCVDGVGAVRALGHAEPLHAGECVLVPAVADEVELYADGHAQMLEISVDPDLWEGDSPSHNHDFDWLAEFVGTPSQCDCDHHHHHHDGCDCGCNH
ncbi:MAG: class I mannose-6-phosphate isomerase [Bacteroidales bacterium]|nr:class I mannose-6-phosphate isomerase [Bacteroidales bacterium]